MPEFCAHIGYLFTELDLGQRFKAAADAGFKSVEHPRPYLLPKEAIADHLARENLHFVQLAMPMGDAAGGEKGLACLADRRGEFQDGLGLALEYAAALSCQRIHMMAGIVPDNVDRDSLYATYLENLIWVAGECDKRGVTVLVEAINSGDVAGYFIDQPRLALRVLREAGPENCRYLLDFYHCGATGEDIETLLRKELAMIGHIQIADYPGRHQPGAGNLDFDALFALIDELGYDGWVGCEYVPTGDTLESLDWFRERNHRAIPTSGHFRA